MVQAQGHRRLAPCLVNIICRAAGSRQGWLGITARHTRRAGSRRLLTVPRLAGAACAQHSRACAQHSDQQPRMLPASPGTLLYHHHSQCRSPCSAPVPHQRQHQPLPWKTITTTSQCPARTNKKPTSAVQHKIQCIHLGHQLIHVEKSEPPEGGEGAASTCEAHGSPGEEPEAAGWATQRPAADGWCKRLRSAVIQLRRLLRQGLRRRAAPLQAPPSPVAAGHCGEAQLLHPPRAQSFGDAGDAARQA